MMQHVFSRISAVSLFLALILAFSGCASKRVIINALEEREANEILVFLASRNIGASKIKAEAEGPGGGGLVLWDVAVPSERATEAMAILNANGLPRRKTQNLLDLFSRGGLVPSEMQERIRYQAGLAEQIAGTIRKIDGILDADIQLSFPEEDPLNPKEKKASVTASVFVKHQGVLDDPNSHLITKIRRLVASSVQGLSFENVTIISDRGRFSEANAQSRLRAVSGNTDLVKIWGVTLAKQSIFRFQMIFFSIIACLVLFALTTLWLLWKIVPVARQCGSLKTLFYFHPYEFPGIEEQQEEIIEEEKEEETAEESDKEEEVVESESTPEEEPSVQENIEST